MGSSANVQGGNLELTPMRVNYDGIDLGGTHGHVEVAVQYKLADLTVDQFGGTPVDSRVSSQAFHVKFTLAELQKKENWKVAFPHAKLVDNGVGGKMMYFDAQIGDSLLARSKILILHPLSKDDSDKSGDYKFFKAGAKSATTVKYGHDAQSGLEVEMHIYPDSTVLPARFFIHGDPSIGVVAATIAAAVAAGGNTGNGTIGSVTPGSKTATETITVQMESATRAYISGSTTGAIGLAIVGTPFVSNYVNLTITAGGTAFIANDSFTLAATGPNYA